MASPYNFPMAQSKPRNRPLFFLALEIDGPEPFLLLNGCKPFASLRDARRALEQLGEGSTAFVLAGSKGPTQNRVRKADSSS